MMDVNQILENRRKFAREKKLENLSKIRETIPDWEDLELKTREVGLMMVMTGAKGQDISSWEKEFKSLQEKKKSLLKEYGYSLEDLKPKYTCSKCEDKGELENGKMCSCKEQLIIESYYDTSNLKQVLDVENFDTFDLNRFRPYKKGKEVYSPRENMEELCNHAKKYVANFSLHHVEHLLYYGPVGTGKTFLLNSIAKSLLDKGYPLLYLTAYELVEALQFYKFSDSKQKVDLSDQYYRLLNTSVLMIDDLGTEISSAVTASQIFELLNYRIRFRKTTIISTNLDPLELGRRYSPRIFSRIYGNFSIFHVDGDDLRLQ